MDSQSDRGSRTLSIVGVAISISSLLASIVSTYLAYNAWRDARVFAFDISCGPPMQTKPDFAKIVLLGIDFPTFATNGDTTATDKLTSDACTVYNLSKEPVSRLSIVALVSDAKDPTICWPQNITMEGFVPEGSKTFWIANGTPQKGIDVKIQGIVRYIDPLDGKSRVAAIPVPLAELSLPPPPILKIPSRRSDRPTSQPKGIKVSRSAPDPSPGLLPKSIRCKPT